MIAWHGCLACRLSKSGKGFTGSWADAEEVLDPEAQHRARGFSEPLSEVHLAPLHRFTLEDFGVPLEMEPSAVTARAELFDLLHNHGIESAAWLFASRLLDVEPEHMALGDFRTMYAGQWQGKPTRALRKHYHLTSAGTDHYYMWRLR